MQSMPRPIAERRRRATIESLTPTIDIPGRVGGLGWDTEGRTLWITDFDGGALMRWSDGGGLGGAHRIAGARLGQPAAIGSGTVAVPLFGCGSDGGIALVDRVTGEHERVAGLDRKRSRAAVAVAPDGDLLAPWFIGHGERSRGGLALVSWRGGEEDVVQGLVKPIGLAISGAYVYLADGELGLVLRAPVNDARQAIVLAAIEGIDTLCAGPDDGVFATTRDGQLLQIAAAGRVDPIGDGFAGARGLAWDGGTRLFVSYRVPGPAVRSQVACLEVD
jgi:sugar lactone lactonase YvrE